MKKNKKYIFLSLIVVLGMVLLYYGFTFAKYVADSVWDYYLQSKGFYFTSDHLGETEIQNVDNLWNGGSVSFNIKNSLNQNVVSSYDIGYTATCTIEGDVSDYASCNLNGSDSNVQEGVLSSFQTCVNKTGDSVDVSELNKTDCEIGGYEWVNETAIKDLYFDISLIDEQYELEDVVVNISVNSTQPYKKTITGKFILHKRNVLEELVTMNYKNYDNYDLLIISNSYSSDKCVEITWDPNKLAIDTDLENLNSYLVDSNNYVNGIKFNIAGKQSKSYMFYSKDFAQTYNVNEFTLTELDSCSVTSH